MRAALHTSPIHAAKRRQSGRRRPLAGAVLVIEHMTRLRSDFLRNLRVRLCARRDRDALRSHRLHLRGHGARALALVRAGRGAQAQGAARRGWEQRGGLTEYLALLARLAQGGGVFCW
jgi:hypothetical protein